MFLITFTDITSGLVGSSTEITVEAALETIIKYLYKENEDLFLYIKLFIIIQKLLESSLTRFQISNRLHNIHFLSLPFSNYIIKLSRNFLTVNELIVEMDKREKIQNEKEFLSSYAQFILNLSGIFMEEYIYTNNEKIINTQISGLCNSLTILGQLALLGLQSLLKVYF